MEFTFTDKDLPVPTATDPAEKFICKMILVIAADNFRCLRVQAAKEQVDLDELKRIEKYLKEGIERLATQIQLKEKLKCRMSTGD